MHLYPLIFIPTTGELLGALCKRCGPEVYESSQDIILEGVRCNLERAPLNEATQEEQNQVQALTEKLARSHTAVRI